MQLAHVVSRHSSMGASSTMLDFSTAVDLTKMHSEQVREYTRKSILDLAQKCNNYNADTKQDVE